MLLAQVGSNTQPQRIELDEATGIGLVVGALVVLEGRDRRIKQRIGFGRAADGGDGAFVEFDLDGAVDRLL